MFKTKEAFVAHVRSLHATTHPDIAELAEVFWDAHSDTVWVYPRYQTPDAVAAMFAFPRNNTTAVVDRTLEIALVCQSSKARHITAYLYWMHAWRTCDDARTADRCPQAASRTFLEEGRGYLLPQTLPFVFAAKAYQPDAIDAPLFARLTRIDLFASSNS